MYRNELISPYNSFIVIMYTLHNVYHLITWSQFHNFFQINWNGKICSLGTNFTFQCNRFTTNIHLILKRPEGNQLCIAVIWWNLRYFLKHVRVKASEVWLLASSCLSVCPYGTIRFPLDEFSCLTIFRKVSQDNSSTLSVTNCSRHSSWAARPEDETDISSRNIGNKLSIYIM